jgi:hypothetical protein
MSLKLDFEQEKIRGCADLPDVLQIRREHFCDLNLNLEIRYSQKL